MGIGAYKVKGCKVILTSKECSNISIKNIVCSWARPPSKCLNFNVDGASKADLGSNLTESAVGAYASLANSPSCLGDLAESTQLLRLRSQVSV